MQTVHCSCICFKGLLLERTLYRFVLMKSAFIKSSGLFIDPLLSLSFLVLVFVLTHAHVNMFANEFRLTKLHVQIGFIYPISHKLSRTFFLKVTTIFSAVLFLLVIVSLFFPSYFRFPSLSVD